MNNSNPDVYVPEHVKPLEMAARIYLKKRGASGDNLVPQEHPTLANVVVQVPVWCLVAEELIDLSMKLTSIKEASEKQSVLVRPS